MRLTIIGCSPAWPDPGGAHSGYLVEAEGCRPLLLDCGPGVLARLRQDGRLPIGGVAITHFHLDHCGDLVPWAWMHASRPAPPPPVALHLPPGGTAMLERIAGLFGHSTMFEGVFDVREFGEAGTFDAAGFEVSAHAVEHYGVPAFGFRVRSPQGRMLGYSGDSAPCDGLALTASGTDLFLCEATLAAASDDQAPRGHSSAEEALGTSARRVMLTHRPVELPTPLGVERAVPGLVVHV